MFLNLAATSKYCIDKSVKIQCEFLLSPTHELWYILEFISIEIIVRISAELTVLF